MASSPSHSPVRPTGPIGVLTAGLLALLAVAGIWSTGAASEGRPADAWTAADTVTFTRDVAPILQASCQSCHQEGGIGPMALVTYEDARRWAPLIKMRVMEQAMPPYHYDTHVGIQELQNDWRLSEQEIRTIARWVDARAPMGDPADLPPPVEWPPAGEYLLAGSLGPPDLVIRADPYTVPATGQDRWWRPLTPSGITEDRCIKAIETLPTVAGRSVTHHANSTFVPATSTAEVDIVGGGGPGSVRLSEYALGKIGEIVPADACRIAPAGSNVRWDIHYYPDGTEVPDDQVEVGIWFHGPEVTPETHNRQTLSLYLLESGSGDYEIEPHGTLMTQGYHFFSTPVRIDSWQPHGHLRLAGKRLEALFPDGRRETLSMVSNWNPGWHHSHVYEEHAAPLLPAGTFLVNTAWYDNTANNRYNPDPDQWVGVGDRTADEMSHAWIAVTHLDEAGYERLLAERERSASTPR
jgi:mono/diheme cytochrome c family protein